MALPIRAKDTQEGCNPISSNCVIWQGPDIPCINLCKGDSVSDVTAKVAEQLCTLLDQTNVSTFDITCFNPVCPNPKDFHDLIQLLIDRICALNGIPVNPGGGAGCPDCIVPIAQCLQRPDALGNITATLQLRDYVILIGNEICSSLTAITGLQSEIDSLDTRITAIETNCCPPGGGGGGGSELVMPASVCLNTPAGTPVVDYLVALDTAFCALQTSSGSQNDTNTALGYKCIAGTDTLPIGTGTWNSVPGWIESPTNLAQAVQDLWLIACQQNDAIVALNTTVEELQTQLALCCGIAATCATTKLIATTWFEVEDATGGYFVIGFDPMLSVIPAGYFICPDEQAVIRILPSDQNDFIDPPMLVDYGSDFDEISYPGPFRTPRLGLSGPYAYVRNALFATMTIDICMTNGTDTCTVRTIISNIKLDGSVQDVINASLVAGGTPENPTVRATLFPDGFPNVYNGGTRWVMNLRLGDNNGPIVASTNVDTVSQGSKIEFTFTDLLPGQSYGMTVNIIQGSFSALNIQALNNAVTPAAPAPAP